MDIDSSIIEDSGKFLFVDKEDSETCLFFYVKITDDVMNVILPDGKSEVGEYFVAIMKTGFDYLGKTEHMGILQIKEYEDLVSLDNDYDTIKTYIDITEIELQKYKLFCEEKLDAISEVHKKMNANLQDI